MYSLNRMTVSALTEVATDVWTLYCPAPAARLPSPRAMSPWTVEAPAPQPPNPPHPYPYWARTEPPGSASATVRPTRKRMRTTMDGLLEEKAGFARAGPDAPMRPG